MKYYIAVNSKPQGPYSVEELKQRGISQSTLLWNESLNEWTPAGKIQEINNEIFGGTPPLPPVAKPRTWLIESILCTIFCCQIFGIVAIVMSALAESAWSRNDYDEALNKSRQARTWVIVSVISAAVFIAVYILILLFASFALPFTELTDLDHI